MNQKVKDLRASVTVEGKPLVDAKYTDQQVEDQINLLMNQIIRDEQTLKDKVEEFISKVPDTLSIEDAVEWVKNETFKFVGWSNLPAYDTEFWRNFGSAPFSLTRYKNTNKNLDPNKGHKGMDEIFDDKFENGGSRQLGNVYNQLYYTKTKIEKAREYKKLKNTNIVSEYRTLDEIEENVSVKKAPKVAEILFRDKTVSMKERLKAFEIYGKHESWIHHPANRFLTKIFDIHNEGGDTNRHETIYCTNVVEWWIDTLAYKRTFIDYSKNAYHPKLKETKRNYTPSKEAIKRLKNYYMEILISEGVSRFDFDW